MENSIKTVDNVLEMIEERKIARQNKDWAKADELREKIRSMGYEVRDV